MKQLLGLVLLGVLVISLCRGCAESYQELNQEIMDAEDDLRRSEQGLRFAPRPESIYKGVDLERFLKEQDYE